MAANGARTRQEVSAALGIGRTLVAFHFHKLEQAGLVEPASADQPAVARPGRPPQRYRAASREIVATVPPRRYELLAEILVRAAEEQSEGQPLHEAAVRVARRSGRELAVGLRGSVAHSGGPRATLTTLLTRLGYQPSDDGESIVLTNCPFDRLRLLDTELVCSVNAALAAGYLDGLGADPGLGVRLRPCPRNCCVVLERPA